MHLCVFISKLKYLRTWAPCHTQEKAEERAAIRACVTRLGERERLIIELRYGLRGNQELTQKEVADLLGISQSYISRLEKKILARMRGELERL